jgi:2-polyprenyl-6-methoxyphenol hydroxylase-like FAD-dependent oxidoreductase
VWAFVCRFEEWMQMAANPVDVLVIGAGPAGLTAACFLRQAGISVTVLDRAEAGANTSRAAVVHARTLEVLEQIAVTPSLLRAGLIVPRFSIRDRSRQIAALDFSGLPTRHPYTLMIPQAETERLLEARLVELGGSVRRSCTLERLSQAGGEATATVRTADGEESISARFVIGADGGHSAVRSAIGVEFVGREYEQSFVLADVVMTWPLPSDEVQLFFAAQGLMVVAPLPGGRHRVVATMDSAPQTPELADVQALLNARGPGGTVVTHLVWGSRFRVARRLASRYRVGNAFLVGDAAHVHSPAGGQGMNTGIQDAADLGGALAAVIAGTAHPDSLDGFAERRRPVAAGVVALTDWMTRIATIRSAPGRAIRNAVLTTVLRSGRMRTALATRIAELN